MYILLLGVFIYIKPMDEGRVEKSYHNHWKSLNY